MKYKNIHFIIVHKFKPISKLVISSFFAYFTKNKDFDSLTSHQSHINIYIKSNSN